MIRSVRLLFIFCITTSTYSSAQIYAAPGISFGYCFTSRGIVAGLECDVALSQGRTTEDQLNKGVSFAYSWIMIRKNRRRDIHHLRSVSLMMETRTLDIKAGWGSMRKPCGHSGNKSACRVGGLCLDVSMGGSNYNFFRGGVKGFIYNRTNWNWFDAPYLSVYTKYKNDLGRSGFLKPQK